MFEGVASYLINRFLGKYIQNLDSSNLNVSIFSGDIELTDLQLRPEALVELKLPIEVKAGYVGYIKADIPWTSLFSSSVVVRLEDVYVLAGPVIDRVYDPERERALQNAVKRQMLEALETSATSKSSDSEDDDPSFLEKLYTYVVNNIQISIGRVHLRYEDTVTNPDHPFACGLMLKHISAYTTDARWQPAQMDTSATMIHKLLELGELSVYWNPYIPEQHLIRSRLNTNGWRNLLKQAILKHTIFEEDFDFIIEPVSAEMRLIVSKDNNTSVPKLFADLSLKEIEILLSRQQFLNILSLKDSFQLMAVNQKYRKYHPNVPLKISPRSWWVYAYTAVVEERIRPYSWERIKEHRTKYRKYKDLYKKSLGMPDHESIKSKLRELEEGLDVTNIVIAREQAKAEYIQYSPERLKPKKKKEKGWFSSWFSSSSDEEVEEVDVEINRDKDWLSRLTDEERDKLYQGIGYDVNANKAGLPKEYIENKVQVNLKSCSLSLVNYSKKILQVSVTQMLGSWETRPVGKAFRISCHTESFSVEGASIEHELVPVVTSDVNVYAPSVNQVFTLDFESNPLYVDADFSIKMNIQPVEVVYDEHSISEIKAFFQLPSGGLDMKTAAMETLQNVAIFSKAGLIYAIEQHKTVHVAVNMKSPYVVVPEFGTLHRGGNVLIADLGMVQIKSELQPKNESFESGNLSDSEIAARLYDQFNITITDVKILLADSGDDWHTAQIQPTSEYHILPSMKLIVDFYNTVNPDYKELPQQKLITTLPTFELNISDKRMIILWKFFRNFPLPTSTSVGVIGEDMIDGAPVMSASLLEERLRSRPPINLDETQLEPNLDTLKKLKKRVLGRIVIDKTKPKRGIPKIRTISDDVDLPYRDDEMENWTQYEEVKPVDDVSFTTNTLNIMIRVVVREVVIQLFKSLDKQENPYLMFRADRLRLDAAVTQYGVAAHACLGAIQLVDKIHVGTSGEYMELLSTEEGTDLISVMFRKVSPDCPDFEEVYHSVEKGIRVEFRTLNILFDQGAIMYLRAYVEGLISSIHNIDMITSASTMVSSVVADATRPPAPQKLPSKEQSPDETDPVPSSVVQLNVLAYLHDLSLTLADNNSRIAEMHIRDLQGHMIMRKPRMAVKCQLKDIDVTDCSHGALYSKIMMLGDQEDSLFKLSFVHFREKTSPVSDNRQEEQPFDYKVNLRVGHLQFVGLNKFYWELRKFIEPFLSREVLDTASLAMETVTKQVDGFKNQNKRFGITVDMMSPTILIPWNSTSTDLILLKSGDLHVDNVFDSTDVGNGVRQEWNHIYISLNYVQLSRAKLSEDDDAIVVLNRILEPMTFQTDLRLALEPEVSEVHTDISAKLEKIRGTLSQKDIQLLLGILRENRTEGAPQPDPDPVRGRSLQPQTSIDSGTVVMETPMSASTVTKKTATAVLFTLEGMDLTLTHEKNEEASNLAQMSIGKVCGKVDSTSDGETKVTVALETLCITDIKEDSTCAVKKVLYYDEENVKKNGEPGRPLVSVIYKITDDGNKKADIMMEKVILNVHIPYILEFINFYREAFTNPTQSPNQSHPDAVTTPVQQPEGTTEQQDSITTVYFSVNQPEIVLFADSENANSRTLVVNSNIVFEYVGTPSQQKFWSKISNLRMFSSVYGAPSNFNTKLVSPCDVEFSRSFDTDKDELVMKVQLSKFYIHLTPATLRLLMDVMGIYRQTNLQGSESTADENLPATSEQLWGVKSLSSAKWLDKVNETDSSAPAFGPIAPAVETIFVKVEEVCMFFEVENLDQTVPLLCLRSSLEARASNWSEQLRLTAELELDVCYYNEKLSIWEPLVEPNMEEEGVYKPWELRAQVFQAQSYPIVCSYDDNGLDLPDGLQSDVEQMINRNNFRSSSSENEADEEVDSPSAMTILRPKVTKRRIRIASDKSYESLSRHSSIQGESDSESEGLINNITNKLGSIFSSDSSDADVSETDENDDTFDPTLDKPIFLTPCGPMKFRAVRTAPLTPPEPTPGPSAYDEPDGVTTDLPEPEVDDGTAPLCMYAIFSSRDKLQVNVTPQAISVIRDLLEVEYSTKGESSSEKIGYLLTKVQGIHFFPPRAIGQTAPGGLMAVQKLPALEIHSELGVPAEVVLHKSIKVHEDYVHGCTVCRPGEPRNTAPPILDDINVITEESEEEDEEDVGTSSQRRPLTLVNQTLANAGHMLISAGGFVFDDDCSYLAGTNVDKDVLQIRVEGFDPAPSCLMNRACRRLVPLTPKQHHTKYYVVYDVDMNHSHRTISVHPPLQLKNSLTIAVDVFCHMSELQNYKRNADAHELNDFTKLATVQPGHLYYLPLYAAYHCALYVCPAELEYEKSQTPIWWPDLLQTKDRSKFLTCFSENGEKFFNIKVMCEDGAPLRPPQMVSRTIPYFTLNLHPPVVLHNYLPYDLQFALEGSSSPSSLTHGDNTPLYTVDIDRNYKLNFFVSDYLGCDWRGTLDITKDMEEFKAVTMETDQDPETANKHLSLSVHFNLSETWKLYIYSPYWIVNKSDLTVHIRGSMSDSVLECSPSNYPQLFRYKKHKRKKAKLKVYESNWSHSFSLDTVGNYGVVECCDTQRNRKYTFMVQSSMSRLKLTKIITITPFFLVVNRSKKALRYMEENKDTDLWFDLAVDQCAPFWPTTNTYRMFVKYENSNIVSQHFPFRQPHSTVLRMEHGTALCVTVAGGTQTPITIQMTDYDPGDAPVRVENFCDDVFIKINQKNQSQTTILASNQTVLYTWDDPTLERTLMWNVYGNNTSKTNYKAQISKDGYGQYTLKLKTLKASGTIDYVDATEDPDSSPEDDTDETDGLIGKLDESLIGKTRSDKVVIFWVSYLDNQQRVLLFTQDERIAKVARKMNEAEQASSVVFVSVDGLSVSVINGVYREVALLSVSSLPAVWEVEVNGRWKMLNVELQTWLEDQWKNGQKHASLQQQFEADLEKMQLLKPYMGALKRSFNPGLWLNYRRSVHHMSLHAKIQRIQLDNQLPDAYFPTVLHPSPIPMYVVKRRGQRSFIEVGLMRRTVPENNVDTIRYLKVLVQEFNIKLDKGFMMSLYDVFAHLLADDASESAQLQSDLIMAQRSLQDVASVLAKERPHRLYFEYLRLSPLKMHVSFSLNGKAYLTDKNKPTIVSDIVDFFLGSVGATLTEMKDVELRMAYFEVQAQMLSWKQLLGEIQSHYTQQAIQQAYVLILGLDVLGNPYGLIKDFTRGLGDFFYEPFLDSVQGSDDFADSIVRGVHSMLGNTVGGAAGSVARITGSLGNAFAFMTLDTDYRNKRRAAMQQRPSSLPLSLVLAGKGFLMGVCLGLSGVVLDPIRGAQEEGVEGFFKGVGKGIMGLISKPAGGVLDMVSMAFDGVQRAAELEHGVVHRMRKPRFINPVMGLRPYSEYQASGYNLLLNLNKGQYAKTDIYWAHAPLSQGDRADMLFITDRHLLLIQKRRCWGGWEVEWEVKVDDILGVPGHQGNKLIFKIKQDESSLNLFAGGEQEITSFDPETLKWIQKRIENLIKFKQQ